MAIDKKLVKDLQRMSGAPIGQCATILNETGGDVDKSFELLQERGIVTAQKKSERNLGSGSIGTYVHSDGRSGGVLELLCETDFVSKNEDFAALARELAVHAVAFEVKYAMREDIPEEVLAELDEDGIKEIVMVEQTSLKESEKTIGDIIEESVAKFGERIQIGRVAVFRI